MHSLLPLFLLPFSPPSRAVWRALLGTTLLVLFVGDSQPTPAASARPTVLVFKASWCPICRRFDRQALQSPEVLAHADSYRWVEVDIDRDFESARRWNVRAVPQVILLDADEREVARLVGAQAPEVLAAALESALAGETAPPMGASDAPASSLEWAPEGYRSKGLCFAHVGYGPLHIYSQSPFQSLRQGILPRTPSTLSRGQFQARGAATWTNVWAEDEDTHRLDYEALQVLAALSYGLTDKLELEIEVQDRSRFGGAMDGFVQGFHDAFGVGQNGRDEVPKGRFNQVFRPGNDEAIVLSGHERGSFSRSVQLSLQHNVTRGTERMPALSYSLTTRYELLDRGELEGGSDLDAGASVALAQRFGQVYVYASLGYTYFGQTRYRGIALERDQVTLLLAGEWKLAARHSLVLQFLQSEAAAESFGSFADSSTEVTLGWKWEFRSDTLLEIGLIENIVSFDNSPDFGIHVGVSRRFG